ncbi:MAG: cryptochrome/photolyase family protein [Gammaproteobacteria bacterium]|nr:cryptochrome/photolyase family protein [Gammaproteobacteria bacterium]|tara:strand:- start:7941 stop:9470 length:1530 start_codon:yes stop_codon:yes gene_type:complete
MKLALILGDQLSAELSCLRELDKATDLIVMAEVGAEARYVKHHKQKIALLFCAMRHFASTLEDEGWRVHYHAFDAKAPQQSLLDVITDISATQHAEQLIMTECGEYRLHHDIVSNWQHALGIPVTLLCDDRFMCSKGRFADWARGRKQWRMEYFYREMRRDHDILMDGKQPTGGEWNFDSSNRRPYRGEPPLPALPAFSYSQDDHRVFALVEEHFADHPGTLTRFNWPVTRDQARQALADFVKNRLPWFGDFQDAMTQGESFMFHSLLSTSINCGLLSPREVCNAALEAYQAGQAPLNATEGFIRQILGWREYVRGLYWLMMPAYANHNSLGNTRRLPAYYWTGDTGMNCMREAFQNTLTHAYAHHIQRLMVTGNFALLTGVIPKEICDWYLAVYADAYDWVELPNTLGMVMHADEGLLGSKPYAASGNYINKMSDYCKHCRYSVKTSTDADSCPFNSLYWHFMNRHRESFSSNPRMTMIYRSYDKMADDKKQALMQRATHLLNDLDNL